MRDKLSQRQQHCYLLSQCMLLQVNPELQDEPCSTPLCSFTKAQGTASLAMRQAQLICAKSSGAQAGLQPKQPFDISTAYNS
jgi:hypothetical protein